MIEKTRERILNEQNQCEESKVRTEEIKEEINKLVEELKKCEIVTKLKSLGMEYLYEEELQSKLEELQTREIESLKFGCTHPILAITGYKKHNSSNRVISVPEEKDAEYASVKCLECGKLTYTKNKDESKEWYKYIFTPLPLQGRIDTDYVKRVVIEIPTGMKFSEIYNYYQEIMLDQPQKETINKVLEKINKKLV